MNFPQHERESLKKNKLFKDITNVVNGGKDISNVNNCGNFNESISPISNSEHSFEQVNSNNTMTLSGESSIGEKEMTQDEQNVEDYEQNESR